jgi:hypothetical protein
MGPPPYRRATHDRTRSERPVHPYALLVLTQQVLRERRETLSSLDAACLHLLQARALHSLGLHAAAAAARTDGCWLLWLGRCPPGPLRHDRD